MKGIEIGTEMINRADGRKYICTDIYYTLWPLSRKKYVFELPGRPADPQPLGPIEVTDKNIDRYFRPYAG